MKNREKHAIKKLRRLLSVLKCWDGDGILNNVFYSMLICIMAIRREWHKQTKVDVLAPPLQVLNT
ncbi:hypothetical protein GWK08_13960 [Leptobacterium flavescens]|uniref:Uncharacterized protein n=1 Tax=Leptobacterium flavescens TaxID=472055 RepID=A0A6P0UN03_9FLAO|nr:hypothetical protein [Leptobacterium flavescens]NER14555.1 hypothetical protein [Leptobacterium flavescens]